MALLPTSQSPASLADGGARDPSSQHYGHAKGAFLTRQLTDLLLLETPDAVAITTPSGEIVYWNLGAERLFGYSPGEAIGKSIDALIVPHGHVEDLTLYRREALTSGSATFETARVRKDGSLIYTVVSNRAVYDARGLVEFLVITQKDVTHIKVLRDAKLVTNQILIVAVTSHPEKFTMAAALEAGCDAYLHKPVSTRTLPETLRVVV